MGTKSKGIDQKDIKEDLKNIRQTQLTQTDFPMLTIAVKMSIMQNE